jgi:hypothetical protein
MCTTRPHVTARPAIDYFLPNGCGRRSARACWYGKSLIAAATDQARPRWIRPRRWAQLWQRVSQTSGDASGRNPHARGKPGPAEPITGQDNPRCGPDEPSRGPAAAAPGSSAWRGRSRGYRTSTRARAAQASRRLWGNACLAGRNHRSGPDLRDRRAWPTGLGTAAVGPHSARGCQAKPRRRLGLGRYGPRAEFRPRSQGCPRAAAAWRGHARRVSTKAWWRARTCASVSVDDRERVGTSPPRRWRADLNPVRRWHIEAPLGTVTTSRSTARLVRLRDHFWITSGPVRFRLLACRHGQPERAREG